MANAKDIAMLREAADDVGVALTSVEASSLHDTLAEKKEPGNSPFDTLAFMGVIVRTPDPKLFGTKVSRVTPMRRPEQAFPNFPG